MMFLKERGIKAGCFDDIYHCHLATTSVHMHAYCYSFCKVEQIQFCEQSLYVGKIEYYCVNTKNNSKMDYSYNDNRCTIGYGDLIISIL